MTGLFEHVRIAEAGLLPIDRQNFLVLLKTRNKKSCFRVVRKQGTLFLFFVHVAFLVFLYLSMSHFLFVKIPLCHTNSYDVIVLTVRTNKVTVAT